MSEAVEQRAGQTLGLPRRNWRRRGGGRVVSASFCLRGWGVATHSQTGVFRWPRSALCCRMIEDMTIRKKSLRRQQQSTSTRSRSSASIFAARPSTWLGGCSGLSGASGFEGASAALAEPGCLRLALLLRRAASATTIPERIAYAREPRKLPMVLSADEVVRFLELVQPEGARGVDHGLCSGSAGFRSGGAEGPRYRQRPHGDADRTREGRQGALRHAPNPCSASCAAIGD